MADVKTDDRTRQVRPGAVLRELQAGPAPELPALTPQTGHCEPELTVHRDGDRIICITARCVCGREMEIQCDYEQHSK